MLTHYWKGAIAGVALLTAFILSVLADPTLSGLIPPTVAAWFTGLVAILGTVSVVLKRNELFAEQVDKWLADNGYVKVDKTKLP